MKTKKVAILLLLVVLSVALLTSCSKKPEEPNNNGDKFHYGTGLSEDGFFLNVTAANFVTLPEYVGSLADQDTTALTQAMVQEQVDMILAEYGTYEELTDRPVVDGDTLSIDYVGKVDGIAFDGGNTFGQGTFVTIGVTQYIDDFLEQLIGHSPGETFDIDVTFPADYHEESLKGKDAVFTVTINHIQGAPLAQAELTDEIVGYYGFDSVAELLADIEEWAIDQQRLELLEDLIDEAELSEIPAIILDYVKNVDLLNLASQAEYSSMDMDTFLSDYMSFDSLDAYLASQTEAYEYAATRFVVVQAIAEHHELKATDQDITEQDYDDYVATYGRPYLKLLILQNKIVPAFVADVAIAKG